MTMAVEPVVIVAIASLVVGYLLARATRSGSSSQTDSMRIRSLGPLPEDLEARLRLLIDGGRTIEALKELRMVTGLGLKEAKDVVDSMASGRALQDIINRGSPSTSVASDLANLNHTEPIARVKDLLRSGKKIEAIKLYRETSGLGLKEAKNEIDKMATELR